jgi:hypothetical protein
MIFLSHNYKDKDVVGPIAVQLAEKFGQDNVFYDSWSIRPGDGIIGEMNNGLERCKYFFFFISRNSLESKMVSLEWQAALHKSTNSDMRFIPIKVDNANQPVILIDKLYIDMYKEGLDQTLLRMIDVIENKPSVPYADTFENVIVKIESLTKAHYKITVSARKFAEPALTIIAAFSGVMDDITFKLDNNFMSKTELIRIDSGMGRFVECQLPTLSPEQNLYFSLKNIKGNDLGKIAILKKVHHGNGKYLQSFDPNDNLKDESS